MLSLLIGCQTPKSIGLKQETHNNNLDNSTINSAKAKSSITIPKGDSSIYPVSNYNGYYYKGGILYIVGFPKTILDTFVEGNYKTIRAR